MFRYFSVKGGGYRLSFSQSYLCCFVDLFVMNGYSPVLQFSFSFSSAFFRIILPVPVVVSHGLIIRTENFVTRLFP